MTSDDELLALQSLAVEAFENRLADALIETPSERPLACGAGCSVCCHQSAISVSILEALVIANVIRARSSADVLEDLIERLVGAEQAHQQGDNGLCPLLEDGLCTIYDVRPLMCRGANSYDAQACALAVEQGRAEHVVPVYPPQVDIAEDVLGALGEGIAQMGYDDGLVNLISGVSFALRNPDAAESWRNGTPALSDHVEKTKD